MTRAQLLASLTATTAHDGLSFDDGRYVDWSSRDSDGIRLELGVNADAAWIPVSWDEMRQLQQALTVLLLEHDQPA